MWALQPFAYLFNKFWSESQPVIVGHYRSPNFELPPNFTMMQMLEGKQELYNRWTNGPIEVLESIDDEFIIIALEDFWIVKPVRINQMHLCYEYMSTHPEVARIGLTNEHVEPGRTESSFDFKGLKLLRSVKPRRHLVNVSFSLWRRLALLEVMKPDISALGLEFVLPHDRTSAWVEKWDTLGPSDSIVCYIRAVTMRAPKRIYLRDPDAHAGKWRVLKPDSLDEIRDFIPADIKIINGAIPG